MEPKSPFLLRLQEVPGLKMDDKAETDANTLFIFRSGSKEVEEYASSIMRILRRANIISIDLSKFPSSMDIKLKLHDIYSNYSIPETLVFSSELIPVYFPELKDFPLEDHFIKYLEIVNHLPIDKEKLKTRVHFLYDLRAVYSRPKIKSALGDYFKDNLSLLM